MPYRFTERPNTRQSDTAALTETREYLIEGIDDPIQARVIARDQIPEELSTEQGLLFRQGLDVREAGDRLYYITVSYGQEKNAENAPPDSPIRYSVSFDTTGGTVNIKVSKQTTGSFAASGTAVNYKGLIGVREDGEVDGVDVVTPSLKMTVTARYPVGYMTTAQWASLARQTGKINSTTFLGFGAGEVLFLGASGSQGDDTETTVSLQFACSETINNLVINGITVTQKLGWNYLWMTYEDVVDSSAGSAKATRPKHIYVERVYDQFDMASFFGFGG